MKKIKTFGEFVNESSTEFSNYNQIFEAESGGILGYFTSSMNYSKRIRDWEDLYTQKKEMEVEQLTDNHDLAIKKEEKLDAFETKKPAIINKSVEGLSGKARASKREALEKSFSEKKKHIGEKIQANIDAHLKKYDTSIGAIQKNIDGLSDEYPISDPTISAKWTAYVAAETARIDLKYTQTMMDMKFDHRMKMDPENEENTEKRRQREKEKAKIENAENEKRAEDAKKRALAKEKEWEEKIKKASADQKDAMAKLDAFEKAYARYARAGADVKRLEDELEESVDYNIPFHERAMSFLDRAIERLNEADPADASGKEKLKKAKEELGEAGKELDAAVGKITKKVIMKINGGKEDDAEKQVEDYSAEVDELKAAFGKGREKTDSPKGNKDDIVNVDDDEEDVTPAKDPVADKEKEGYSKTAPADDKKSEYKEITVKDKDGKDVKMYKKKDDPAATSNTNTNTNTGTGGTSTPESVDTSDYNNLVVSENKNVLSFEEFVNESRKNSFTF